MVTATRLTLTLKDEPGSLARVCRDLADGGVNLLALAAPPAADGAGTVRLLVANPALARQALTRAGYQFEADEVFFIELKNRPGALAKATEKLHRAGINIVSAYATAHLRARQTAAVIEVPQAQLDRARRLLAGHTVAAPSQGRARV